jgi:hypothetical protein
MLIIGADYHPSFQQIAFFSEETGECGEQRLSHDDGEAERFYRDLKQRQISVRVGMEATGYSRWFERLLAELGFEVWIGDPAEIRTRRAKKQKTDSKDAELLLKLMREDRFPRIWTPSPENRDLRQLLWHRHRLVQMRTRIKNQLQALAMNENKCWKKKLWSERGRADLSLALGIGVTSAVLSVIYAILINPYLYPYRDADRIVEIHLLDNAGNVRYISYTGPQAEQFRQLKSFESVSFLILTTLDLMSSLCQIRGT